MNVAIPIRDKVSIIKDWELRHSILSIRKFTNADKIFVIGRERQKPNIPDTEVIWIDYRDNFRSINPFRHENVRRKILKACDVIGEPFLLSNDDIFFLQDAEIESIPLYYNGTCEAFAENKAGQYKKMLQEIDGLCFELHTPMIVEPDIFKSNTEEMKLYRSPYGNASELPKEEIEDVKSYGKERVDDFKGLPFVSTSEAHLSKGVKMMIRKMVG